MWKQVVCKIAAAVFVFLPLAIIAGGAKAFAQECSCEQSTDGSDRVFAAVTAGVDGQARELKLRFPSAKITRQNNLAFLCISPSAKATEAKLWMPDHNHGSTPTTLVEVSDSCTRIERVRFSMLGGWEIRIKLADGDHGTFGFDVVNP